MNDGFHRWMTQDGSFRILAVRSTETCREAARVAGTAPEVTELYSRLLTGTALMQLAQAPIDRVQCTLHHDGTMGLVVADVWPGPAVRGRVEHPAPLQGAILGDEVLIQVSRRPARGGEIYQSAVPVQGRSIANALQQYVLLSEQALTLFALAAVLTDDGVLLRSGGMLVQALPGATREHLATVTECLEQVAFDALVSAGDDPIEAASAIFDRIHPAHLGTDPLVYRCRCDRRTAVGAVLMLDESELETLRGGGHETVVCEFCGTVYEVSADDLDGQ